MKKILRHLLLLLLIATAASSADAQVVKGQKTFGVHGGYVTRNRSGVAGIDFEYTFSKHFRLAPSVDYIFSNRGSDGFMFNIDYHGPYPLNSAGTFNVYHVIGLNYASWHNKVYHNEGDPDADVSTRDNRFGFDFGAGLEYYVQPTMKLSFEGKFNWLRHYNTGLFYFGISYVF
ncbi:MAG: porin family protein [Lachnoclostridium sp.]|nr:porin family protein [Lachnoclostridium sp.]